MDANDLVVAVRFDPPGALERLRLWRDANAAALAELGEDEVRIDIGRAVGGSFAQVWLPAEVARRLQGS